MNETFLVGTPVWWEAAPPGRRVHGRVAAIVKPGESPLDAYQRLPHESWRYQMYPGRTRPTVSYVVRSEHRGRQELYWPSSQLHPVTALEAGGMRLTLTIGPVNWDELCRQKEMLLFEFAGGRPDWVEGLLGFIDDVQDQAAERLGEAAVFGETLPEGTEIECGFCNQENIHANSEGCCNGCGRRAWVKKKTSSTPS